MVALLALFGAIGARSREIAWFTDLSQIYVKEEGHRRVTHELCLRLHIHVNLYAYEF